MAANRGRTMGSFGQAFMPIFVDGSAPPVAGQPFRVRGWGVPTNPSWYERPGKWNYWEPPPKDDELGRTKCGR